jgi:hypothetical protein
LALPYIITLLEENTRWGLEKADEWKREAMMQEAIYVASPTTASSEVSRRKFW